MRLKTKLDSFGFPYRLGHRIHIQMSDTNVYVSTGSTPLLAAAAAGRADCAGSLGVADDDILYHCRPAINTPNKY